MVITLITCNITLQKLWLDLHGFRHYFGFWGVSFRSARWRTPLLPELLSHSEDVFCWRSLCFRGLGFQAWFTWFHLDDFQQFGQLLVPMVSLPWNQFPTEDLHAEHFSAQELENHLHTMADLQKSASSPALMNAGAAMSHVPKRATQHACFLASWEVPPACLKPGQATAGSRVAPWQKDDGMGWHTKEDVEVFCDRCHFDAEFQFRFEFRLARTFVELAAVRMALDANLCVNKHACKIL